MTLLYVDSFAHGNNARYVGVGTPTYASTSGRVQAYSASGGNGFKRSITPSGEVVMGFGVKTSLNNGQAACYVYGDSGATTHLSLIMNGSNTLSLYRGNVGTLLATGTFTYATNTWFYVELRCTIADSGGTCKVRVNGSGTDDISFTGDTKNAGTSTNVDAVSIGGAGAVTVTDWYVLNTAGSVNNTWRGDVVVRPLAPTGDGDLSGLLGSDGNSVANWQQVDELPASTADYNGSPTSGAEDTYAVADLPANATTVYGVQVAASMAKSDAGAASSSIIARLGGTDYTPGAKTLGTSYAEFLDLYETNPATSTAWTTADVNGLQVGMKVT